MVFPFDACIVGSGFAGSLLGWILSHHGWRVAIVDRGQHPRFAIGESSTPLADFLLEQLADEHALPTLRPLSRWGSWQQHLPQLRAGKKRGFSYFAHSPGHPFTDSDNNEHSWLVAASSDDPRSDTHWMRADVDEWLCERAQAAGAQLFSNHMLSHIRASQSDRLWQLQLGPAPEKQRPEKQRPEKQSRGANAANTPMTARFIIDASGGGGVLGQHFQLPNLNEQLLVRSAALYGHFRNVQSMRQWQATHGLLFDDDPFNPDDAAQHHLLRRGWCWMLRFSEGTTSVGLVSPQLSAPELAAPTERWRRWSEYLEAYPTLKDLLGDAQLVAPESNTLGWLPRISRLWSRAAGLTPSGLPWAMLPGTVGIVDPLHSSGIAHGLWGVRQLARVMLAGNTPAAWQPEDPRGVAGRRALAEYSRRAVAEVQWIDRIVAAAYASLDYFPLFQAACGLYFVAAIHSERHLAEYQQLPCGFLLKDDEQLQAIVSQFLAAASSWSLSSDVGRQAELAEWLRGQLAVWDDVGLFDPQSRNRVARSVAPKA